MTDFLSRLVEQESGRGKRIENGIRPLIPPFFAPTPSRPAQTILWPDLSTLPGTISLAPASDETMFPPEQPERSSLPADLVPEHLRQLPLPSPLIRNLLTIQEVVRPRNDEIAQDIFSEEKSKFGDNELNTVEEGSVNLGRDNIHAVYNRKEVASRYQISPSSADLAPESGRSPLTPSTNDQRPRLPASDGGPTQSRPDLGSRPHPGEQLAVARSEDQLAMIVPTPSDGGISMGALPEDAYDTEARHKITYIDHQSVHHPPQPLPRSGDPASESLRAPSSPSAETHPPVVEQFIQEKLPVDSVHNDPTLTPRLQSLQSSGSLAPNSIGYHQRKDRIDGILDPRTTTTSPQPSSRLNAAIPDSERAPADPAAKTQHPGELTSESRRAQAGHTTEAHHDPGKFTPEREHIDSVADSAHNDTDLPLHPQSLSLPGALVPDSVILPKRDHIDGIPASRPIAASPQSLPHHDDPTSENRHNQADPSSGTQYPGVSTFDGHTTRRRFHIDSVRPVRKTPDRVDEHDATITPMLPAVPQYTIVPLIEDEAKQKSATQQPAVVESPPPAIHICIGRVEVRAAIPESTPASRPARASRPGLTLSEYMQQRKEHLQ